MQDKSGTLTDFGLTVLQKAWIGETVMDGYGQILDIAETIFHDKYVICFLPNNKVHPFVTWSFDPDTKSVSSGHYCFTVTQAVDDLRERVGH